MCRYRFSRPANLPHPSHIGFFIAAVLFPVFHGDRVPHNMVVDAFGVKMGTDHRLKFPAEQPIRKFHSDLMRQFRGDFSGSKALHHSLGDEEYSHYQTDGQQYVENYFGKIDPEAPQSL